MFNNRLGHTTGELLAQGPNRLTDLCERRCGGGQLGFDLIKPPVKALMELLAQGFPLFSCTDLR
jgi:hypothetical protein